MFGKFIVNKLVCKFNRMETNVPLLCKYILIAIIDPPVIGGFPSQSASDAENVSISWRHHDFFELCNHWGVWNLSPGRGEVLDLRATRKSTGCP